MTIYRNPEPETLEQPLPVKEGRDFFLLLGGLAVLFAVLFGIASLFADWLAVRIPFSAEKIIYQSLKPAVPGGKTLAPNLSAADHALQQLAQRVASSMDMPDDMEMTVHLVNESTVNAAETLGGHVFVFTGLIKKLPSEDALAAVLAHEFGHLKARHPIRGVSKGMALVAAFSALGIKSAGLNRWLLSKGTELTVLSFSRDAEQEADRQALTAVYKLYGHVAGIMQVFELFTAMEGKSIEMLRTHPLSENRRRDMIDQAEQLGYAVNGKPRPLPPELAALKKL